ncbi:GSCFA domain-containing protein [Hansschlegelia zhihuaiae]|nr:GSCFA domain-containing protein [Hansschlegelia zhihuaiae]
MTLARSWNKIRSMGGGKRRRKLNAERSGRIAALPSAAPAEEPQAVTVADAAPDAPKPVPRSPYEGLPARAFWRSGVTEQHPLRVADLYRKKFALSPSHQIATAGSCFAQHIARRLKGAGYSIVDREPAPLGFDAADAQLYGYGLYSARYGNIYTARQLLQLAREAFREFEPAVPVWRKGERFFDALRPSVEPEGLASAEEVTAHRAAHLKHVRGMLKQADVIIFTFGLTETWEHRASGTVYPTAPGTIAGRYDPAVFAFRNLTHSEVLADFLAFRKRVREVNPTVKFLLTVSPVPLTATASGEHVLPATIYSKSVLRGVAGELYHRFDDVDYFPSYEMVAGHPSRGFFYEPNMRAVANAGVDVVMRAFFEAHGIEAAPRAAAEPRPKGDREGGGRRKGGGKRSKDDVVCEEMLLEAFAK